jgi:multiple sugar transport system permease protein
MNRRTKTNINQGLRLALMIIIMVFLTFPFIVALSNGFKTEGEINQLNPTIVPNNFVLSNYRELFEDKSFLLGIKNSAFIATVTMIVALVISLPAAYSLVKLRGKSGPLAQTWIVLSQMVPIITLLVPLYMILKSVKQTDSFIGIILVYTVWSLPTTLWLLKGFIAGFPEALEEAAKIDGCNTINMFVKILLPNILPGVLTAGIFAFIGAWNEFFFALSFLRSPEHMMLSTKLYAFIGLSGQSRDSVLAAATVLSSIPGILVFSFFQRYYVSGMTEGAVK